MELLSSTPVSALVPADQKLVFLQVDANVEAALALLKASGISYLPISWSAGAPQQDTVSYSDLVQLLVKKNFDQRAFLSAPVTEAVHSKLTILVAKDTSVETLLNRFVKSRPYRVAVADDQQIQSAISQIDLVRFLYDHRQQLIAPLLEKDLLHMSTAVGSVSHTPISENATIRDAVTQLADSKLHALAVVNEVGAMKACLTPQSFRSLSSTHWPDFNAPIKTAEVHGRDPGWVAAETKIGDLLKHIVEHNLHRVWVIGDDEKPKCIITLTDVLLFFYSHITGKPAPVKKVHKEKKDKKKDKKKDDNKSEKKKE